MRRPRIMPAMTNDTRTVAASVPPAPVTDGAGVRIRRALGTPALPELDPFLMLDEFRSDDPQDYIAGFPDHPHRGFETVTYMLAGRMQHRDHAGHSGELGPGSVQWMTAGRGIIHSEMPLQEDGLMWGFQLWINLPASDKMIAPRYQEFAAGEIPRAALEGGGEARIIAGELGGRDGPVRGISTRPLYADLALSAGSRLRCPLPPESTALVYVFQGAVTVAGTRLEAPVTAPLAGEGDALIEAAGGGARLLRLAATPRNEPVVRYGPFVMNTREQIMQAFEDYRSGALGRD